MLSTNKSQSLRQDRGSLKNFAVIVAAGLSRRFGDDLPKQFQFFGGICPLLESISVFEANDFVSKVICVIPEGFENIYHSLVSSKKFKKLLPACVGGETRQISVLNGLHSISSQNPDFVLIHDAARYNCPKNVVDRVIKALHNGSKAVVPVIPVVDSLRYRGLAIDRSKTSAVQTPQGFDFKTIFELHKKYVSVNVTDDASLCDLDNIPVQEVEGDIMNRKLTYKTDVEQKAIKTGFGYDAHRFSNDPSRKLFLLGKEIEDHNGLEGISDADVGIHSLVDAILGALSKGSIGEYFPPSDPNNIGRDSKEFLKYCKKLLTNEKASCCNIDITIVCESPNISKHSSDMRKIISECLEIPEYVINIKGKTTEGMGFEGRREGISAYSIVTICM